MQSEVASGTVRLNGRFFDQSKLIVNKHRLSQRQQVSYPTMLKYMNTPEEVKSFSGDVLYAILVEGMGYSVEEVANLRLGDVFEFVKDNGGAK